MTPVGEEFAALLARRLREAGCVFAEAEATVLIGSSQDTVQLEQMVCRRVAGMPLEHVVGWVDFVGVRLVIEPGVFVPRPRTEFLVREALALARPDSTVVDLCCGSGAIGRLLAERGPTSHVVASDIDPAAVRCARRNLDPVGGRVFGGDLFGALPAELRGVVDVLVVNAPYVPSESVRWLPREARLHEPLTTLDGGVDGLDVQRRVMAEAADWIRPGGHVLIETSRAQADRTADLVTHAGLTARTTTDDELDATVVIGRA